MSTFVLKYLKPNDFYNSYLNSGSGSGSGSGASTPRNTNIYTPGGAASAGGSPASANKPAHRFVHSSPSAVTTETAATVGVTPPTAAIAPAGKHIIHLVTVDEVDGLGYQNNNTIMQTVIKSALCSWLDTLPEVLKSSGNTAGHTVALIGTTNKPNAVDMCLRRGGRLDREVILVSNSPADRSKLIELRLRSAVGLGAEAGEAETDTDIISRVASTVGQSTGGYVAADISMLCNTVLDVLGGLSHHRELTVQQWLDAFDVAMVKVRPSCLRGVSLSVDGRMSLDDVIGQSAAKDALRRVFMFASPKPAVHRLLQGFHLTAPGGVLFHGPPGNSKTRLVLATASHYKLPLISLSSADVYSAYLGEAEEEIRKVFRLARQASPCILFFDEVDALVTNRTDSSAGNSAESRVLATFLTELDGVSVQTEASMIFVMAATNRLDAIDPALLRKGRFDHCIKVDYPDIDSCRKLFEYFGGRYHISAADIAVLIEKHCPTGSVSTTNIHDGDLLSVNSRKSPSFMPLSGAQIENISKEFALEKVRKHIITERLLKKSQ